MRYGKTTSGLPAVNCETGWHTLDRKMRIHSASSVTEISRLEFVLLAGTSPEKVARLLQRHFEIIKRRHELFLRAAMYGKVFTQQDILGSESDD